MTSPFRCLFFAAAFVVAASAFAQSPTERAAQLLDQGQFLAAEQLIEPLALAKKPDPVAVWELSRVRIGQQLTEDGIKLAEKAIKLDPTQARFHAQLGSAYMAHMANAGRLDRSSYAGKMRKAFEKALQLDPKNVTALAGLARYHWNFGTSKEDLTKATEYAEAARKLDAYAGEFELGSIAVRRNDMPTALAHFEAAIAAKPDSVDAHTSCGLALLRLGRRAEARERFQTALKISPAAEMARDSLQILDKADELDAKKR